MGRVAPASIAAAGGSVGIAGVLAFSVSARTNEIDIRMSLGADSTRVQRITLAPPWPSILHIVFLAGGQRGRYLTVVLDSWRVLLGDSAVDHRAPIAFESGAA